MLMWTQCTICLSSHHTKRAPEQPSILLVPFFLLSTPSPFLPVGWEEKLRSSQWAYCLPSCWFPLPFFASHPLILSKAPRQLPFLYLLSFSHFLPLDPDSSSGFDFSATTTLFLFSLVSLLLFLFQFRLTCLQFTFLLSGFLHWSYAFGQICIS